MTSGKHSDPRGDANAPKGRKYHGRHRADDKLTGWRLGNQDPVRRGLGNKTGYSDRER